MTIHAIAKQLGEHMNKAPDDGPDLIYALVKIRKVLEHEKKKAAYWTLTFFCDWILHTQLYGDGATKILELLDKRIWGFNPARPGTIDPDGVVLKILSFDLFREHLLDFLQKHDLPTVWAQDEFAWKETVVLYGEEVRDTPLALTKKNFKFKRLKKIVISACVPSEAIAKANPKDKFYGFRWEFFSRNGARFAFPYTSNQPEPPPNWRTQGTRSKRSQKLNSRDRASDDFDVLLHSERTEAVTFPSARIRLCCPRVREN
jgi:hypothetical protein